jgi:hypothetical protein
MATLLKLYIVAKAGGAIMGMGPLAGVAKAGIADLAGGGAAGGAGMAGGAAMIAAAAGVALAVWQGMKLADATNQRATERWDTYTDMARILSDREGGQIDWNNEDTAALLKDTYNNANTFKETLDGVLSGTVALSDAVTNFSEAAAQAAYDLQDFAIGLQNAVDDMNKSIDKMHKDIEDDINRGAMQFFDSNLTQPFLATGQMMKDDPSKKKKKDTAGSASMTVNGNINFTISSNQAPDQIAREVEKRLIDKRRFRTSSPGTRNFSVLPSGT